MAAQDSDNSTPILAVPISVTPPTHNPTESVPNSNPFEFFESEEQYPHANTPSIVTETELRVIKSRYQIPDTHLVRAPESHERMYQRPDGWTAVPVTVLDKGVRFPLHSFLVTLLGFVGVGFAQLVPNSYIHILAFIAFCYELGIPPTVDSFFTLFTAGKSRERGFKLLSKQSPKPNAKFEKRPLIDTPSSNKGWHREWFFVKGPETPSIPEWTTSERISADFGDIPEERVREMASILERIPLKEWSFGLLSKQAWLYDHKLSLIKPTSTERGELDEFLSGKTSSSPADIPQKELAAEPSRPRHKKRTVRKIRANLQGFQSASAASLIDMPANERMQTLRIKKRKTMVTPLSADELRVPPPAADPPTIIPTEIHVSKDELEYPTESLLLSRKRKQPSEDQPPPPPEPSVPSPTRSSPSAFRREAASSPTVWPEFNANFPFQLFESFVRETDDHRFGNSSIRDLIEEGMSYQAKANAVFGRLLPRYRESEAEEDATRREKASLASALERERRAHGATLLNNEGLQKDVNNLKEKLETAEATHQITVSTNIDLVRRNEVLVGKNETMVKTNKSLAVQVHELEARDLRHLKERAKLEEELRELRALRDLGPPLTGDLRREIQQEYRKSAELNEEIVQMFSDGYDECRSKDKTRLVAAKVDPTILDSSEGEADP